MIKWLWILLGGASTLGGLAVLWSPLPLGLPLLLIGIPILMKYSPHSRRAVFRLAGHYPRVFQPLQQWLSRYSAKSPPGCPARDDESKPD